MASALLDQQLRNRKIIVLYWSTRTWYPKCVQLWCYPPTVYSKGQGRLMLPCPSWKPSELFEYNAVSVTSVFSGLHRYNVFALNQNSMSLGNRVPETIQDIFRQSDKYCQQRRIDGMFSKVEVVINFKLDCVKNTLVMAQ